MADASGDGRVSAGEHVVVGVTVRDMSGLGYNSYPGVVFEVEEPGVEFVTDPRAFAIYALGRCDAVNGEVELAITQLEPPAVVRVVARAAELNRDCPDAPALEVSIPIE
jgi:hypothetical protein